MRRLTYIFILLCNTATTFAASTAICTNDASKIFHCQDIKIAPFQMDTLWVDPADFTYEGDSTAHLIANKSCNADNRVNGTSDSLRTTCNKIILPSGKTAEVKLLD